MLSPHAQLLKWSFPAFALILGLLWYKRRRADTADPGVHIDESFTVKASGQTTDEIVSSPRRVSESLDIPVRKSASRSMSLKTGKSSSENSLSWYKTVEIMSEMEEIQLGSNPKTNNFEMLSKSRLLPSLDSLEVIRDSVKNTVTQVFENVTKKDIPVSNEGAKSFVENVNEDARNACALVENYKESISNDTVDKTRSQGQASLERDSANHSPVSGVLEGSVTDEARSEGSTDSGKGGSINGHAKNSSPASYEFVVPQNLVGRLIGRHGCFLQNIRIKAEVKITIKRHPTARDQKMCVIEGSSDGISMTLSMIRQKFPEKKYPTLTLERVSFLKDPEDTPWTSELMYLSLIERVNNDVVVCNILQPNHLFVQLPMHPTYPSLRILDGNMTQLYNITDSPPVPSQLRKGMIVVAKLCNRWVRVCIENPDPKGEENVVRLVDHGGFWTFSNSEMRKIRSDYLALPFQAIEVFLANIKPTAGEWMQEAYDVVAHLCSERIGQAQIEAYVDANTYINLYFHLPKHGVISLADELIARGLAEPTTLEDLMFEEEQAIA